MLAFRNKESIALLICIVFLCVAGVLWAGGKKEDRLSQARELIEERRYNQAIQILAVVMRTEPEKFDVAQQLLNKIRKAKKEYNDKYQELLNLYTQEELDMDRAYEIFQEMEELDQSPNKATAEAFENARQTAVFVYNNNRFEQIMQQGLEALQEGDYWGAVENYLTGFDLYIEEYNRRDYGTLVENRVEDLRSQLSARAGEFTDTENSYTSILSNETEFIEENNIDALQQELQRFSSLLISFEEIRREVIRIAVSLEEQNQEIQEGGNREEFHLTFLNRLALGRDATEQPEGITGAIDLAWRGSINQFEQDLVEAYTNAYSQAKTRYTARELSAADENFEQAREYGLQTIELLTLWETRIKLQQGLTIPEEMKSRVEQKLPVLQQATAIVESSKTYTEIIPYVRTLPQRQQELGEIAVVEEVRTVREELVDIIQEVQSLQTRWQEETTYYQRAEENGLGGEPALEVTSATEETLARVVSEAQGVEINSVDRIAQLEYEPIYDEFERQKSARQDGLTLLTGYEKTMGEGETQETIEVQNPRESRNVFQSVEDTLAELEDRTRNLVEGLTGEKQYVRESDAIQEQIQNGRELIEQIQELSSKVGEHLAKANEQIELANKLKNEADYRISQARQALENNNFDQAREHLRIAGERYYRSLEVQEDPQLRQESDELINSLGEQINTAENNLIVREVRDLIEQGKQYYSQENYADAERVFQKAQNRWKVTHVENKPEIDYWLGIVRVALNVKSGRTINEKDPLYPEMSQLLNLAREDFLQGKQLVEDGKEGQAEQYFEEAEQKILYVKIPFPLNREASILSLRIEKYRNLENFEVLFRDKFQKAREKLSTNPQEAYIELQDLEAINPDFPGLDQAIYQAELELGIRVPPPDPEKIAKSNELYQKAYEIVQSNVRSQYPIALEYLNNAIKLTPNSQKVTNLLDRIEAELGGRTTTVLSSIAQEKYKQAEQEYLEGNYYEALRIVSNLMKDEQNSQYPPLLELKRRIESKI